MADVAQKSGSIQCTAGAIPVKNEKGQVYMQKVKVQRYMAGKRPGFASDSDSDAEYLEDTGDDREKIQVFDSRTPGPGEIGYEEPSAAVAEPTEEELKDPRYRRIMQLKQMQAMEEAELENDDDAHDEDDRVMRHKRHRNFNDGQRSDEGSSEEDNEADQDIDDEELAKRRELIRQRALQSRLRREEDELATGTELDRLAELEVVEENDRDDYSDEEYSSSEDEMATKLKPVFVRKHDRITLKEKQRADILEKEAQEEAERMANDRRRETLKLLEAEIRREAEEARVIEDELDALDSDDAHGDADKEQEEYELWKVRELKRIRREREIQEVTQQEKDEIERIRRMTDEQRREEFRKNPKKVTNKAVKGKYKFLQKYYHRGAFFVSTDEDKVFQRDFAAPTLEDHFDKTKLRSVMQVKNFGRAGQTKYTHLVDQDTTDHTRDANINNAMADNFQRSHGGGLKAIFEKPTAKRKK